MREQTNAFRVLVDDYVTAESGTGIVHQAPYFGEVLYFQLILKEPGYIYIYVTAYTSHFFEWLFLLSKSFNYNYFN